MQHTSNRQSILWFLVALIGSGLILTALLAITLGFVLPEAFLGSYTVVLVSFGLVASMLGAGLLIVGIKGWRHKKSVPITTRWGWLVLLLILVVLGGIALLIPGQLHTKPIFALFHFGMIVLPAFIGLLIVIRLAGTQQVPTYRQIVVAITGGSASVLAALPLEIIGFIFVGALIFTAASIFPGGQAEVTRLLSVLQHWTAVPPDNVNSVMSIADSPIVIVGVILILSFITPLIEEFVKTLVLGIMGIWARPGLGLAFIWGVSCGLGFAMVEGIANGSVGLEGDAWWLGSILARFLATMMHALTSGFLGLGWGSLWQKKWWRLPLFYASAVVFHGMWNFSVLILVFGGILSATQIWIGGILSILGGSLLLLFIFLVVAALIGIPLFLKRGRFLRDRRGMDISSIAM